MTASTKLNLMAGTALALLALPAAASFAAEVAAPDSSRVGEVVVTAEKRRQNLIDVPQSVSVLAGERLDLVRASSFEDYITSVPDAILVSSQPGSSRLVLRGVNAGGVSSTIGTYVDETPYGSVTGLNNGAVLAPDIDTFDMQRVEVLRGPQGTLYGASSLGGLLKFVTNAPDPSAYAARAEVDGDDIGGALGGSAKGMLNAPLGDRAAVRISGAYDDEPGFIDDPLRGAKDVNETRISAARVSFLVRPTDRLTLRLTALGQDISSRGSATEDINPVTLAPLYGDLTQSRTFSSPNKVAYRIYNLTANYDFGIANLISSTSYATLRQDTNEDATALYGALLSEVFKQPLGAGLLQNIKQKKFTQEVRLQSPEQKFQWLIGGFYTREMNQLHQNLSALSLVDPPQVATGFGGLETVSLPSTYSEYAGFANADYHFTPRFDLSAGGRYSHNDQTEAQTTAGPLAGGTSTVNGSSSDDVFTFAVAPKYKLSDDASLYARVSKGYRPGGPNALNPLAPATVPRTFASDTLIDYETGIKADVFDHRVSVELTGYYIDWSHIQLLADVGGFGVNTNGGSAVSKGVETTLTWVPAAGLILSANGTLDQANLTSDTPAILGGRSGDRLPYSPRASGAFTIDYERPVSQDLRGFVGLSLRAIGQRYADFNPTIGQVSLPAYATLDLRAGLDFRKFRIEAYVKNLNDERGILQISGVGSTPEGAVQAGLERPRTFGLSLSAAY